MKNIFLILSTALLLFSCTVNNPNKNAMYVHILKSDDITRLIPRKGVLNGGVTDYTPEASIFKNFWTENWKTSTQSLVWHITTEKTEYEVAAIIKVPDLANGEKVTIEVFNGDQKAKIDIDNNSWQRLWFSNPLKFTNINSTITAHIIDNPKNYEVQLFSLEVTKPETRKRIYAESKAFRSDVTWMADIKYGFFFHWNSKSMPLSGEQLSYEEAVNRFDTDKFAKTVYECGGKLIFFTTTWAEYYFPAPIKAIDNIIEGRTTKRDLIADLSNSLAKYGIKLIIYYHEGQDDKEWWSKQNFSSDNPGNLYTNIEKIVTEVSMRYADKLSGFWFDDGMAYYPNEAPFEKIAIAAKSGNKNSVICFNPWIFPKLTEFQDFFAGERTVSLETAGLNNPYLPVNGSGKFTGGPQEGLQSTFSGLLESGDWTHLYKDTPIPAPILTIEQITEIVKESNKRKNLPMFNVRIYQDGNISPMTYKLLKELNSKINL